MNMRETKKNGKRRTGTLAVVLTLVVMEMCIRDRAMEPLFTTKPEQDRSGMGFSFMEAFMDELEVISKPHVGTLVKMRKTIGEGRKLWTIQSY